MPTQNTRPKGAKKLKGDEDFSGLKQATDSLHASWYYDEQWYTKELDSIFYENWLYVCHASTLIESRSYRSFNIGSQSIILVRGENGELHGFHNTCRHRGSQLCKETQGKFASKLIVCPYHQWAYSFDGQLQKTTSHAEAANFDKADYPLFPVHVEQWRGGIFVNLSENPKDLKQGFARGADRIENWPMEKLVVGHRWQKTMQCNWKVFWENFNECLHCPNIHPDLSQLVPIYGRRLTHYLDEPYWTEHQGDTDPKYAGGLRADAETWSTNGQALSQKFPDLTDEEIQRGQSYFVSLPSVFIAAHVDYMRSVRILPIGPEQTEIEVEWLFLPEALEDKNFGLENITEFAIQVMQEDAHASQINQAGIRSRKFEYGVLMPEEHYVKQFQDWVKSQMKNHIS